MSTSYVVLLERLVDGEDEHSDKLEAYIPWSGTVVANSAEQACQRLAERMEFLAVTARSVTPFSSRSSRDPATTVDPITMEVIDLPSAAHDRLVEVFLALQAYERRAREWRIAVEDELVRRHGDRRAAQPVGEFEVDVDRGFTRVWDPEELYAVTGDLLDRGLLRLEDISDLTVTQPPKVDGRKAQALLNRVDGDALVELRRCFTWAQKGRAKVKVTPVASLEPPAA